METTWHYASNTFEVMTRGTNKKALILFEDSRAKLIAEGLINPAVQQIANDFEPYHTAYRNLYAQKQGVNGMYEGRTFSFELLMDNIPEALRDWEGQIHYHYREGSAEDRTIFPNRRKPFLSGPYELRISAIKTLLDILGNYPSLATTVSLVTSFYNQVEGARLIQQQHEGDSERHSALLEAQRKLTCRELYGVLGRLMYEYRDNPDRIGTFFDLSLLRHRNTTSGSVLVEGVVTDKATGLALQGVSVQFSEGGYETTTDANGKYSLSIEHGTYKLRFNHPNYLAQETDSIVFLKGKNQTISVQLNAL